MEKNKTCQVEFFNRSPCGRPLYDGEHCIFHSKDKEKKEKFKKLFWEEFKRQEKEDDVFDFNGFVFPGDIDFGNTIFKKPINFDYAEFHREIVFYGCQFFQGIGFIGARFYKVADFERTQFFGVAQFLGAKFFENVNFDYTFFSKDVDFQKAEFLKETSFKSRFSEEVIFQMAEFSEKVSFSGSSFGGFVDFIGTRFSEKVIFRNTRFEKKVDFIQTEFIKEALFFGAQFDDYVLFSEVKFHNNVDLSFTRFEDVDGLFDILQLKKRHFLLFKKTSYKFGNFKFFLGDKSADRYPVINRKAKDYWYLKDYKRQHPNIYRFWKISSNCGQKLSWWAGWALLIALFFGFVYADYSCPSWLEWLNVGNWMEIVNPVMVIDSGPNLGILRAPTWFTPYYFSIVTFTTLGFGDVTPANLAGEIWLVLEVIFGYIMLGGLISIFATKLARRS